MHINSNKEIIKKLFQVLKEHKKEITIENKILFWIPIFSDNLKSYTFGIVNSGYWAIKKIIKLLF